MTTKPITNLPASVQARLLKIAHAQEIDFQLLLNRYIIERFLYRLSRSPERDKFALKGAMLFALWVPRLYRMTRDLDLLGQGSDDVGQMVRRIAAICQTIVEDDAVIFQHDRIEGEPIRAEEEYVGGFMSLRRSHAPGPAFRSTSASGTPLRAPTTPTIRRIWISRRHGCACTQAKARSPRSSKRS